MVREFKDLRAFVRAVKRGEVPESVVSPGFAASMLGITRQAVHELIQRGRLHCWRTVGGDVIMLSLDSVKKRAQSPRRGNPTITRGVLLDVDH